jgi:hypothetical protein
MLQAPAVRALYQGLIDELNAGLSKFETIKRFELLDRDLSAEAGRTHADAQGAPQDRVADVPRPDRADVRGRGGIRRLTPCSPVVQGRVGPGRGRLAN